MMQLPSWAVGRAELRAEFAQVGFGQKRHGAKGVERIDTLGPKARRREPLPIELRRAARVCDKPQHLLLLPPPNHLGRIVLRPLKPPVMPQIRTPLPDGPGGGNYIANNGSEMHDSI